MCSFLAFTFGVPLWGENAACRGWKRGVCVCVFCFRDGRVRIKCVCVCVCVCRALSESGSSSARQVRWSGKVGVCVSGVGEAWYLASPSPFAPGGRERVCGVCVCDSLPLHVFRDAGRQAKASWWACVLRRRDLSSLPRSQQTSLLSSPRPGLVSPVPSPRVWTCVLAAEFPPARRGLE
jgi:hypothetical protein